MWLAAGGGPATAAPPIKQQQHRLNNNDMTQAITSMSETAAEPNGAPQRALATLTVAALGPCGATNAIRRVYGQGLTCLQPDKSPTTLMIHPCKCYSKYLS